MSEELFLEVLYQIHLLEKILEKEKDLIKWSKYNGMLEALLFVLERSDEV